MPSVPILSSITLAWCKQYWEEAGATLHSCESLGSRERRLAISGKEKAKKIIKEGEHLEPFQLQLQMRLKIYLGKVTEVAACSARLLKPSAEKWWLESRGTLSNWALLLVSGGVMAASEMWLQELLCVWRSVRKSSVTEWLQCIRFGLRNYCLLLLITYCCLQKNFLTLPSPPKTPKNPPKQQTKSKLPQKLLLRGIFWQFLR